MLVCPSLHSQHVFSERVEVGIPRPAAAATVDNPLVKLRPRALLTAHLLWLETLLLLPLGPSPPKWSRPSPLLQRRKGLLPQLLNRPQAAVAPLA